jgi:hypothetical protein
LTAATYSPVRAPLRIRWKALAPLVAMASPATMETCFSSNVRSSDQVSRETR